MASFVDNAGIKDFLRTLLTEDKNNKEALLGKIQELIDGGIGEPGADGKSLEFNWDGTRLGIRKEGETSYSYVDLKGQDGQPGQPGQQGEQGPAGTNGKSLEFNWNGTQLGIRKEGDSSYSYVDLKGQDGSNLSDEELRNIASTAINQAISDGRISNYDDTELRELVTNAISDEDLRKSIIESVNINLNKTNGTTATITKIDNTHTQVSFPSNTTNYYCYNQLIGKVGKYRNSHIRVSIKNLTDTEMPSLNKLLLSYKQDWSKVIKHANELDDYKSIPAGETRIYDFDIASIIGDNDDDDIYLVVGSDKNAYNHSFIVSCDIEITNIKDYYVSNAGTSDNAKESEHATLSDNSCDTKHATLGAEVLTEWTTPFASVKENYTLEDGIYRFRFRKGIDAEPSDWWATVLSCNIGVTTNLSGKKLLACFSQRTDEGCLKFKKICIANKEGNWSTAYDIITDFSNDRLYAVVDLDEVLGSGIFEVADDKNLYLLVGGTSGNTENPKMNTHNIDWSATAAIIDKDVLSGIGVSQFFGKYTPNDISKLTNDISKLNDDVSNLAEQVSTKEKYITCWGDSLTAMGGWTTRLKTLSGLNLYNGGVGGENCRTILARQGADAIVLNNITIPGDGTPVEIKKYTDGGLDTVLGNKVFPDLQNNNNLNPVDVDGVECSLKWTGASYSDTAGTWTIKRKVSGDDIVINRPTIIRTAYDRLYNNPYLMIIFIGQNKGYDDDLDVLVRQHRSIIEHANAKHVIVLGLHSGDATSRADYETRMKKEFGRYFISLREYLAHPIYGSDGSTIVSCYGIDDQGLVADTAYSYGGKTYNSLEEIAIGKVPHQILMDGLHFSSGTRTVIGDLIYKRCRELNIF